MMNITKFLKNAFLAAVVVASPGVSITHAQQASSPDERRYLGLNVEFLDSILDDWKRVQPPVKILKGNIDPATFSPSMDRYFETVLSSKEANAVDLNWAIAAIAVEQGDGQMSEDKAISYMQRLLAAGADVKYHKGIRLSPPLGWAAKSGSLKVVQFLLDHGADPMDGVRALVMRSAFTGIVHGFTMKQERVLPLLLAKKPNLNDKTELLGETVLHYAIYSLGSEHSNYSVDRFMTLVGMLISHGADPSILNGKGQTPLDLLKARYPNKEQAIARFAASVDQKKTVKNPTP